MFLTANEIYDCTVWNASHTNFPASEWIIEKGKLPILKVFEQHNATEPGRNGKSVQPDEIPANILAEVSRIESVTVPANATLLNSEISADVETGVKSLNVNLTTVGSGTWKLYSDAACTSELTGGVFPLAVGENKAYVKVTASTGGAETVYTLTVTRAAPPVISIITQPVSSQSFKEGSVSGSLSVVANIDVPGATLSYQWYSNTTGGSTRGYDHRAKDVG